ncbi:alpha/beta fold hydrolase [Motilimonas eburnea]|uniref:alpha/beta fold hydrolase n=1 Tax=Motilimonas eburnea TaxID=1737488 RepID=UPI001E5C2D94|nr:alpha/beta hydrolase [Motilimonas eburnea]MCE2573651.1 alpha/beta hydrolase [Motilimonas eburnea]
MMKRTLLVSAVSTILLAGCGGGGGSSNQLSTAIETPVDAPDCATGFVCDTLVVPTNYLNDDGSTVEVFYAIHKATDEANRIGTLFVNFGGPGGEAHTTLAWLVDSGQFDPKIVEQFDLVALDPRGTGQSAYAKELTQCATKLATDINACNAFNTTKAANISTNTLVKDIDALRTHLGEEQISFLGYSYGTRVGSVYANTYPERVRALVLDAPMSPDLSNAAEFFKDDAAGYELAARFRLESDARYQTLKDASYYLYQDGVLQLNDGELTLDTALGALYALRESSSYGYWQHQKAGAFELLDNGNTQLLNSLVASTPWWQPQNPADDARASAMFKAVLCADELSPLTNAEVWAMETDFSTNAPVYGPVTFHYNAFMCADWPGVQDPVAPLTDMDVKLQTPILIIGGEYDTRTSYVWAEAMAQSFASLTRFIRVENVVEHGFSYRGSDCIDDATTAYLLDPAAAQDFLTCDGGLMKRSRTGGFKPHPVQQNPRR